MTIQLIIILKVKFIMASFKLKFRPSVTQGQEGTLYFQVIHRRVVKMIYTDFHIRQDEWNDTTSFIRITGTPERQAFLQLTASKVQWNTKQLTAIITDKETARVNIARKTSYRPTSGYRPARHGSVSSATWPQKRKRQAGRERPRLIVTH